MGDPNSREFEEIRALLAQLTERVYRLEQSAGIKSGSSNSEQTLDAEAITAEHAPQFVSATPDATRAEPVRAETHAAPVAPPSLGKAARDSDDLESRIGSQWLNRIGIVAVLIGVSYFLKYAFENNWIGPAGRVAIGLLTGIGVVWWSERFRNKGHRVFSWSLKAVGLGTLYLSLWAGFQAYRLFPAEVAFTGMVIVTAATTLLAISQDAQVLAAFALVGGFSTPLLLSSGQNREVFLFSYVAVLDLGTLVLAAYRPWRKLLAGAFVGTVILYSGWYVEYYHRPELAVTIAFATVFFAIFAVAPLFIQERPSEAPMLASRTSGTETISKTLLVLPLVNAALYFLAIYVMLAGVSKSAVAWIAVVLAAVYLLLSREMRSRMPADAEGARLLTLLHIALAVGFLTAAIPIKLASYWITVGWLVESGALLYVSYRAASRFLKVLSLCALALGIGRLVVFDDFNVTTLVLNPRFAIYLIAIAVVTLGVFLASEAARRSQGDGSRSGFVILFGEIRDLSTEQMFAAVGIILINVLALLALNLEAHTYFSQQLARVYAPWMNGQYDWHAYRNLQMARDFTYSAIWMIYGAALMWIGFWKRSAFLRWQALILLAATVVKVFFFDTSQLEFGYRIISFIALGALLMAVSFIYQRDWLKLSGRAREPKERNSASA
jgi:uncharacterized membrane protein